MRILSFLFCEDVRKEVDGKSTIVGVFDGLLIDARSVAEWPAAIRIAAHMRLQLVEGEPVPDENILAIKFNEAEIARGVNRMKVTRLDLPVTLVAPMIFIPIAESGKVVFEYTFKANGEQLGERQTFSLSVDITGSAAKEKVAPAVGTPPPASPAHK